MVRKKTLVLGLLSSICAIPATYANAPNTSASAAAAVLNGSAAKASVSPGKSVATKVNYPTDNMFYENKNTGTELRFGARAKADFYYDAGGKQPGSTFGLDPAGIPLERWDADSMRRQNFNASLTASRLSFDVKQHYGCMDAHGYIETDFNGGLSSGARTNNGYVPRIRLAYGELSDKGKVNELLIGQNWSNFSTIEVNPYTANNLFASLRQAQVRYTRLLAPSFTFAVAVERPNTQYYQFTNPAAPPAVPGAPTAGTVGFVDNDTAGSFGKSAMPDLTMKLQYYRDVNLFALRGVVRRLDIKTMTNRNGVAGQGGAVQNFTKHKLAWGLGASAMFKIANPVTFMMQVQGGDGIGRYIDDLGNQNPYDSFFQFPTSTTSAAANAHSASNYQTIKAINFIAGFTINWKENLETNIGGAYTKMQKPKNTAFVPINAALTAAANTALPNSMLQRYHVNLIYTVIPKTFLILEAEQYYRQAAYSSHFKGKDTRFIFSFIRNF